MASPSAHSSPILSPSDIKNPNRKSSFGFLHRPKSRERIRKASGGKIIKGRNSQASDEEYRRLQANPMPTGVLKLPELEPSPRLESFGGENLKLDGTSEDTLQRPMETKNGRIPIPPVPAKSPSPETLDPYSRAESMTHRGRYSYAPSAASTIDSPRMVRRRKDPTPFNVLVVGARNSGKTSFIDFLRLSLASKKRLKRPHNDPEVSSIAKTYPKYVHHYLETEIDGERVGVTLWDSPGMEKSVVDLQLRDMSRFIQSKFEETFSEEMKVFRAPGVQDTHIHCVFLILDPAHLDANVQDGQKSSLASQDPQKYDIPPRVVGALDEDFDLEIIRTLRGKTSFVPVISKADTVTAGHMAFLKKKVHEGLRKTGLDPLEALSFDADEEPAEEKILGTVDKFDERDEDDGNVKTQPTSPDSADGGASPRTSDSETLPHDGPSAGSASRYSHRPGAKTGGGPVASENGLTASEPTPLLPYSILSPDSYSLESGQGQGPVGRSFPWGFADPYNPGHCDFIRLKEYCFGEWRAELREASKQIWYERWRTSRLNSQGVGVGVGKAMGANRGVQRGGGGVAKAGGRP